MEQKLRLALAAVAHMLPCQLQEDKVGVVYSLHLEAAAEYSSVLLCQEADSHRLDFRRTKGAPRFA